MVAPPWTPKPRELNPIDHENPMVPQFLVDEEEFDSACELLGSICASCLRVNGPEHHHTLRMLGWHSELLAIVGREEEAAAVEKKVLEAGKALLKQYR